MAIARKRVNNYGCSIVDLLRGFYAKKDHVSEFEKRFADYIGCKYAIAVCSGRYALELILKGIGLKPGDEVIVPSYTFYIVIKVILKLGLKPVFVDIDPKTANIDVNSIKTKITKKTRAILVTHLFGRPAELDQIQKIVRKNKIFMIEDCAQAHGTEYKGKKVGSFGRAGFFSLDTTKPINALGGGVITTDDSKLAALIRKELQKIPSLPKIRLLSRIKRAYKESSLTKPLVFTLLIMPLLLLSMLIKRNIVANYQKDKNLERSCVFKFSNFQARMAIKQLALLDKRNLVRVNKAKLLLSLLRGNTKTLLDDKNDFNTYTAFLIVGNDRWRLSKKLLLRGIDSDADMMQNCGRIFSGESFKNARMFEQQALRIPLDDSLSDKQVKYIAKAVNGCIR